jgi:hypothetical protein
LTFISDEKEEKSVLNVLTISTPQGLSGSGTELMHELITGLILLSVLTVGATAVILDAFYGATPKKAA